MIEDAWRRSTYPMVPGHEIVGTIVKKGALAEIKIGERVGISWVRSACLTCPQCLQGNTNICPTKLGVYNNGRFGGFADHVIADSRFLFSIPEAIDSAHAAPLLCAGATVYAPLHNFRISPAHSIGVIGIGGLGHLALQFYAAFGCEVSALSSSRAKEKEVKGFGAHHFYTLDAPPPPLRFDFLLCTIDASLPWNQVLSWLRPNGTLCLVSRPPEGLFIDPAFLVSTQRSVCGSNNANRFVMNEMLSFAARHKIAPMVERMPLASVNDALDKVRSNKARYRIVLHLA
jgi:uncharacterized zinc-type alcohol dehydrogenase-like protein